MTSKKTIFIKSIKILSVIVSISQISFFLFMLFGHGELPVFSELTFTEKWMFYSIFTMLLGTLVSIFFEFLGALIMLLGYAIKIFTDGIDYNFFFDSFIVLSFINFLIFYLKHNDKSR